MTTPTPDRPAAGAIDPKLLEILVCPLTKSTLEYDADKQELISRRADRIPDSSQASRPHHRDRLAERQCL